MDEDAITRYLQQSFSFSGKAGIGDDCSVERWGRGCLLVTTDILIEDIHFRLSYQSPRQVAFKAVAVNVSDILAMGGRPESFYLALGIPSRFSEEEVKEFFQGVKEACGQWSLELAGGDLSRSDKLVVSVAMKGRTRRPVFRSQARPGDLICLSGPTGEAGVGLELLERGLKPPGVPDAEPVMTRFHHPPIDIPRALAIATHARAMIDVSDGVIRDLERLLRSSGRGAEIEFDRFPRSQGLTDLCGRFKIDLRQKILAGGEDYVLLFTLPEKRLDSLRRRVGEIYPVGQVTREKGLRIFTGGRLFQPRWKGFDHFGVDSSGQ